MNWTTSTSSPNIVTLINSPASTLVWYIVNRPKDDPPACNLVPNDPRPKLPTLSAKVKHEV